MGGSVRILTIVATLALFGCKMVGSSAMESAPPPTLGAAEVVAGPDGPASMPPVEPPSRGGNMERYEQSGRTYHVLDSSEGYDERGIASWYGDAFHGRPTSSGERFDMNRVSAAHRTLPLPSWVEVTNLANGRKLLVRVNDRGPFHEPDRRIIDVSYAAAVRLGLDGTGTAPVRVRAVEPWQRRTR